MNAERLLAQLVAQHKAVGGLEASQFDGSDEAEGWQAAGEGLDFDAQPADVVARIESFALWSVEELAKGSLPDFQACAERASQQGRDEGASDDDAPPVAYQAVQTRSLVGRHPESADAHARVFLVLQVCHELLLTGRQATPRELYYRLKPLELFRGYADVDAALRDAGSALGAPRCALGVAASDRGLVAGRLVIHDRASGSEVDCTAGAAHIPGDIRRINRYAYQSDAEHVLIIEKNAVFQRLVEDRLFDLLPCILVTGKGFPDLATRAFLRRLADLLPHLRLSGLVDWNPAGACILSTYAHGPGGRALEGARYALPALRWLGVRAAWLEGAGGDAFQSLTPRDVSLARNLERSLRGRRPGWAAELGRMLESASKAEIEAAYEAAGGAAGFAAMLAECLEAGDVV